jgi:Domain of unknown function (DUF4157)
MSTLTHEAPLAERQSESHSRTAPQTALTPELLGPVSDLGYGHFEDAIDQPVMRHPANLSPRATVFRSTQQHLGNRYTQRMIPSLMARRSCACGGTCEKCSQEAAIPVPDEMQLVQPHSNGDASVGAVSAATLQPSTSSGEPLGPETRQSMESHFGSDFGGVRVHSGSAAALAADSIHADAYTVGSDVYFAAGKYRPESAEGGKLLAHELTHVGQQAAGKSPSEALPSRNGDVVIGASNDPLEHEAEQQADAFAQRKSAAGSFSPDSAGAVRRMVAQRETPKPAAAKDAAQPQIDPANSMRSNIEELSVTHIPKFQAGIDAIDQDAINSAGDALVATWRRIEGTYQDVPTGTGVSTSANPVGDKKPEDVERDYTAARRLVLKSVGTQVFHGDPVLGKVTIPDSPGSLIGALAAQKTQAAWTAKDAEALITLLKQEKLTEPDQWQAVGLLRQHLNPWNFAYMRKTVAAAGLAAKFDTFAEAPGKAYQTLIGAISEMQTKGQVGVLDEVGSLALSPTQGKVRLLRAMTPEEVSGEVYGKADQWAALLQPFNGTELAGKSGKEWLMMGTELRVDPTMVVPQYAALFRAAATAQRILAQREGRPVLRADAEDVAVVGNTLTYYIEWPKEGIWPDITLEWWVENDPGAVAAGKVDAIVQFPKGLVAVDQFRSHDTTLKAKALATGTHTIHCRLTYGNAVEELSRTQTVITLEEMSKIELARGFDYGGDTPKEMLEKMRQELAKMADTPATKQKRDDLTKRIADIEASIKASGNAYLTEVPATFISSEERPLRLPLRLFVGENKEYNEADRGSHLQIWDYTLRGQPFSVTEDGDRLRPTVDALIHTFADKCYYPKGTLLVQIHHLYDLSDWTVTLNTSGPKLVDEILRLLPPDVLRAISMGALGLAVVSGLLGQGEIAVPAFELSVALSGAAAAGELAEKLEHGQFKWDAGTAMQVADLAAALIGAGSAFELTTAVEGAGRVSLTRVLGGVGKGIGIAQIGVTAGLHATAIAAAIQEKNEEKLVAAILRALGDAALFIIVHKASSGKGRDIEGESVSVPHEQLKPIIETESVATDQHDVVVTKNGDVYRCSDNCADLRWLFEQLLDERPELLKKLRVIAGKPVAERKDAARALYEELSGLKKISNLSNSELADLVAKSKGTKFETDLKAERARRASGEESPWEQELRHQDAQKLGDAEALIGGDDKFFDKNLEQRYQEYLKRKARVKQTPRERADWKVASDHATSDMPWARGNAFNKVAGAKYPYSEVHLEGDFRLDSYDPVKGEIVSRKETDFDLIEESTFNDYLAELKKKYAPGRKINSPKYSKPGANPPIDGQLLKGQQYLEVPMSNQHAANRAAFEAAAAKQGIKIRYANEMAD